MVVMQLPTPILKLIIDVLQRVARRLLNKLLPKKRRRDNNNGDNDNGES